MNTFYNCALSFPYKYTLRSVLTSLHLYIGIHLLSIYNCVFFHISSLIILYLVTLHFIFFIIEYPVLINFENSNEGYSEYEMKVALYFG
jgi:hypothetical protein